MMEVGVWDATCSRGNTAWRVFSRCGLSLILNCRIRSASFVPQSNYYICLESLWDVDEYVPVYCQDFCPNKYSAWCYLVCVPLSVLYTTATLDREATDNYALTLTATVGEGLSAVSSTSQVLITVTVSG